MCSFLLCCIRNSLDRPRSEAQRNDYYPRHHRYLLRSPASVTSRFITLLRVPLTMSPHARCVIEVVLWWLQDSLNCRWRCTRTGLGRKSSGSGLMKGFVEAAGCRPTHVYDPSKSADLTDDTCQMYEPALWRGDPEISSWTRGLRS